MKGREGEVEGREREGPQVTVEPGPLRALLRHCGNGDPGTAFPPTLAPASTADQTRLALLHNVIVIYAALSYNASGVCVHHRTVSHPATNQPTVDSAEC